MNVSKKSSLENYGSVAPGLILKSYLILSGSLETKDKETREAQDFCTVLVWLQNLVVSFWEQNNFLTHVAAGESFDIWNMRLCFLTWEKLGDLWPRMQWKVTRKEACTHREPTPTYKECTSSPWHFPFGSCSSCWNQRVSLLQISPNDCIQMLSAPNHPGPCYGLATKHNFNFLSLAGMERWGIPKASKLLELILFPGHKQ